ncbi:MAG TPA: HAD family hydrolase [Verrucomicrobiales bacterium]|nr:HAD family phosphatase [Verrucomicrobiae bacterium]HRX53190.1 HAD family hydrolase [Verrucomicrobiales bacterium]
MRIQLIVADIEGVILPAHRGMINPGDMSPIVDYCRQALVDNRLPPLVFCTGRQIPYLECVAQLMNAFFPGFPSIAENGSFLYDVARNEVFINPRITDRSRGILNAVKKRTDEFIAISGARKEYGKEVCISLNPPAGCSISAFYKEIGCELEDFAEEINITHSASAVDITPNGIDKASGLRFLSQKTAIPVTAMLGIGDTLGDLPFLKVVGVPTGPANASVDVQNIAHFISSTEGPVGVAEILRRYTEWD